MKKTYKIEVDCANCAAKMEDAANTISGVAKATVSFMTQKMNVEFAEGADPKATMQERADRLQESGGRLRDLRHLIFRNLEAPPPGGAFLYNGTLLWKKKQVFHGFHRVFNMFLRKSAKKRRANSLFLSGKVCGKGGGKRGKAHLLLENRWNRTKTPPENPCRDPRKRRD